jgi:RNA polymerase sigma-70 factor, ECF subfamily
MHDFEGLYARYGRDVFRFALYLSGNRADAEDIAAETFARAWTSRDRLRLPTVKAYLLAIARNLHRMGFRGRRRQAELDASLPDGRPGPHAAAEGRDQLGRVLAALQELPETDRAAVARGDSARPGGDRDRATGGDTSAVAPPHLAVGVRARQLPADRVLRVHAHRQRHRLARARGSRGRGMAGTGDRRTRAALIGLLRRATADAPLEL